MENRKIGRSVLIGLLGVLGAGCAGPKMQVPHDVAGRSEVLEATDRSRMSGALADESFVLGPYAVKDVDRKWDSGSGIAIANVTHSKSQGGYTYKFEGRGAKLSGHCVTEDKDTGVGLGGGLAMEFAYAKLACSCDGGPKQAHVEVTNDQGKLGGAMNTSAAEYQVTPINQTEDGHTMGSPLGYRMDGDSGLGAAEVAFPGRVWLDKKLGDTEKAEVACIFVGLMLYKPKEKH
jgi:hypothetical protein